MTAARIRFRRGDGSVSDSPPGAPVVEVSIPHTITPTPAGNQVEWDTTHWALIDTGSDNIIVDADLAAELKLHPFLDLVVFGAVGSAASSLHKLPIFVLENTHLAHCDVVTAPLSSSGQPHRIILGTSFLSGGTLIMDYINGEFAFTPRSNGT